MPQLLLLDAAAQDLRHLTEFLMDKHPEDAHDVVEIIIGALSILKDHPEVGRPYQLPLRELVISRGKSGYLALYWFNLGADQVEVLRVRHQRESGYKSL